MQQLSIRPSWHSYFLKQAEDVASRSTCPRRSVGAVLTANNRQVSAGYNGAPTGQLHCLDIGCAMYGDHCIRTIHAEANALLWLGANAISQMTDTVLYVTTNPCVECCKFIVQSRIGALVTPADSDYAEDRDALPGMNRLKMLRASGVRIIPWSA